MTTKPQDRVAPPAAGPGAISGAGQRPRNRPDDEPTIKPVRPPGTPKPKAVRPAPIAGDPFKFWDDFYKDLKVDEATSSNLMKSVAPLMQSPEPAFQARDRAHAEAAIKGFLKWHGKQAEPWMYEWLVKLIELRKGTEAESREILGYAAFLAKRSGVPLDLRRAADMMVVRKFYGPVGAPGFESNIGELIDLAAKKDPSNPYTPMMSINLALHDKDPKRMAEAAEHLLSLGWPGFDDKVRRDVKEQVGVLEKNLRDDGRTEDADALASRLARSEARDLYIKLTWVGEADIDFTVDEPLGATCGYRSPRTVFGGSMVKNGYGKHPEEVYVCPRAFDGDYTVRFETIFNDPDKLVTEATLEIIAHEGTAEEKRQVSKVDLRKPAPVTYNLADGRRKEVLPFMAPPEPPRVVPGPEKAAGKADPKAAPAGPRPIPIR